MTPEQAADRFRTETPASGRALASMSPPGAVPQVTYPRTVRIVADEPATGLVGRAIELRILHAWATRVRAGTGGGIVVAGAAGTGSSTLVDAFRPELEVHRAAALTGEDGTALAARLFGLPMDTLAGTPPVAVAMRVLDVVVVRAARCPVIWVVDQLADADPRARALLGYLSRRVGHLRAGFVLAGWPTDEPGPVGVQRLEVAPLTPAACTQLVHGLLGPAASDWVVAEIVAGCGGNPSAAREMAAMLDTEQVAGRAAPTTPPVVGTGWTARTRRLAASLSAAARSALRVAAVADGHRLSVVETACRALGLPAEALTELEIRGLVRVDGAGLVRGQGPYVSACLQEMDPAQSRIVHGAVADALDALRAVRGSSNPAETLAAACHRAAASIALPARRQLAGDLERAAECVPPSPAAVAARVQAAELSDDDADRSRRTVGAALAAWRVGRPAYATALINRLRRMPEDPAVRAKVALVRGGVALGHGLAAEALSVLADGAAAAASHEPEVAVDLAARVAGMAWWAGRADWAGQSVELAALGSTDSGYARFVRTVTPAGRSLIADDLERSVPILRRALVDAEGFTDPRQLLFASEVAGLAGDDVASRRLHDRSLQRMRLSGATTERPFALQLSSIALAWQGRARAARESAESGLQWAVSAGEASEGLFQHAVLAHVAALDGDIEGCDEHVRAATVLNAGDTPPTIRWARGRLSLSLDLPEEAVSALEPLFAAGTGHPVVRLFAAPDLVEAAWAARRPELARPVTALFDRWCAAGSPWAAAVQPRLAALLAPEEDRDAMFRAACEAPNLGQRPLEAARTRLAFGLHLRARRRRAEAREQLHAALELFESLELPTWVERTRAALRASGEAAPGAAVDTSSLTDQELAIAVQVSEGRSNREVAEAQRLSSRTVEYHLSKVYVKLGLSSREQLRRAMGRVGGSEAVRSG